MSQLGAFLAGLVDENQKVKQGDKVAKAMYDFLTPPKGGDGSQAANPLGSKDEWDTLSSRDRIARTQAYIQAESLKRAVSDQQLQQQVDRARLDEFKRNTVADDALQRAMAAAGQQPAIGALNQGNGPVPLQSVTPTPQTLLQAVSGAPEAVNSRNFDNVLRAMEAGTRGQDAFFKPGDANFSLPGVSGFLRVPTGPNTSVILSNPGDKVQATQIIGSNGEVLGSGINTRGGVQPLNTGKVKDRDKYERLTQQLKTLIEAQGKAAGVLNQAAVDAYQSQIDQLGQQLKALESGEETSSAKPTSPASKRFKVVEIK